MSTEKLIRDVFRGVGSERLPPVRDLTAMLLVAIHKTHPVEAVSIADRLVAELKKDKPDDQE